jgi:hypothetical protein
MNSEDLIGRTIRDEVTKIEGICIGIGKHLTGCDTCWIQPPGTKDNGAAKEVHYVDVLRITIIVGGPIYQQAIPPPLPGG